MRHPRSTVLLVVLLLCALLLPAGAAQPPSATGKRAASDPAALARRFEARGLDGCFVLLTGSEAFRVNPQRAATRYRPASTFKIVNALAALEGGVAPDTSFTLRWDGVVRDFPGWNSDLSLEQAFRVSCVWYFVELGRLNGRERLASAMRALSYGTMDVGGSDQFWLDGPLRISADEQARAMDRLARGDAPFSARSLGLLRSIMLLEQGKDPFGQRGGWKLYGKTGFAVRGGVPGDPAPDGDGAIPVGWLVGWVERGGEVSAYALNLSPRPGDGRTWRDLLPLRMEIAREMLAACGLLPPQ